MDKNMKNLPVPFVPGDDLYYIQAGHQADSGPGIFEIKRLEHGIGAVQVDTDGQARIVDGETGTAEPPGGPWHCLDYASALEWAREQMPGSVRLDGKSVTALYSGPDGIRKPIAFGCSMSELEELVCSKPNTMSPDEHGIVAVYDAGATRENSAYATFINDASGRPVEAIYGPYLLIRVETDPETGFCVPCDLTQEQLDAAVRGSGGGNSCYDPAYWIQASRMTVAMLKAYLSKLPDRAVLHCCGTDLAYLHYCPETGALSIDCESLSDLPEYDGHEPALIKGPEE